MKSTGKGTLIAPCKGSRAELTAAAVNVLQLARLRVTPGTGWEDFDARLSGGLFVVADLVTSDHPQGWVQLRVRRRPRWRLATALAVAGLAALIDPLLALVILAGGLVETCRGLWLTRKPVQRTLAEAAG